ncbi:Anti-anti-sigma regulatory factor (antagonist of anti-sigma factor) [Fictibacillus solisalsi]|uniref:Anti-anti-sigma regulatory factor (Antagonist of anti-sigma factor) n=1 Tax=Fictibacillus solisalsi TaxID=459525 RepID=A0A1G9XIS9_9BACL|nr:STAS domain-containing protein [Fictibacillus solisalsi]SDM96654.1 Anti-anti-sigma regulatory factor (antagonist of anti-sigma factor) [Fictibacillus solisalsi]
MVDTIEEIGRWISSQSKKEFMNQDTRDHDFLMDAEMISEFIDLIGQSLHKNKGDFKKSIDQWTKRAADFYYHYQKEVETAIQELSLLRQEIWSKLEYAYQQELFTGFNVFEMGSLLFRNNDFTIYSLSLAFENKYKDVVAHKEELLKEQESVISELSVPIIPSIIPDTILVPLAGDLSVYRLEQIRTKLLYAVASQSMTTVVVDFTGITSLQVSALGIQELALQIEQLTASMRLMGVKALLTGFSPELSQGIVQADISLNVPVFSSFKSALTYLVHEKNITLDDITMK